MVAAWTKLHRETATACPCAVTPPSYPLRPDLLSPDRVTCLLGFVHPRTKGAGHDPVAPVDDPADGAKEPFPPHSLLSERGVRSGSVPPAITRIHHTPTRVHPTFLTVSHTSAHRRHRNEQVLRGLLFAPYKTS